MALSINELGSMEIRLRWAVIGRLTVMFSIPFIVTLFFDIWWIEIIIWILTLLVWVNAVKTWGHSLISIGIVIVSFYIYFEWANGPDWLIYIACVLAIWQIYFIKNRIAEVETIRKSQLAEHEDI